MDAILDLLAARPHMRISARFDLRQLRAYHEGYYTALVMAVRVMDEARAVDKHVRATKRAERRRVKSA